MGVKTEDCGRLSKQIWVWEIVNKILVHFYHHNDEHNKKALLIDVTKILYKGDYFRIIDQHRNP